MASTKPIESFDEAAERFPGIDICDPTAIGRLAFHAAAHMPSEIVLDKLFNDTREPWHNTINDTFRQVNEWQFSTKMISRAELSEMIANRQRQMEDEQLLKNMLDHVSPDEMYAAMLEFIKRYNFTHVTRTEPSALFPQGRASVKTVQQMIDQETGYLSIGYKNNFIDANGQKLSSPIHAFLYSGYFLAKSQEIVRGKVESLIPIDDAELEGLRLSFGAKAASLMLFDKSSAELRTALENTNYGLEIKIPPYFPVHVDTYAKWKENPASRVEIITALREKAIGLLDQESPQNISDLVIIRSSAVFSEDSDKHTGAGIYKSVTADPRDEQAFMRAIEEVYASANSAFARSYQQHIGVDGEQMGLLIQQYVESEDTSKFPRGRGQFGYANSSGTNPNLIEVATSSGTLLYDKVSIRNTLLLSDGTRDEHLHTSPDHRDDLYSAIAKVKTIPHAAVIAEQLFGKPVQIEYANNDCIVQVRPLVRTENDLTIEFPASIEPLLETAAVGIGDMELSLLDERHDNSEKQGFVIFDKEYQFTISPWHAQYNALPVEGAVVILEPSTSGHIQALCREKGLLCFYPKNGNSIVEIEDICFRRGRQFRNGSASPTLRFVADGYVGKIYSV